MDSAGRNAPSDSEPPRRVRPGDIVSVDYIGTFEDGTQFDSSEERGPLRVTVGAGEVIPGFDRALVGMAPGELVTCTVPPEEAYGPHRPELEIEVERSRLPDDLQPEPGMRVAVARPDGGRLELGIVKVGSDTVVLDGNHALAGRTLVFQLALVEIFD